MKKATAFPYLLWMAVFIIVPLGLIVLFAVTDSSGRFTLNNIMQVSSYLGVIWKSVKLAAVSTAICLVLGYPLAYIISRKTGSQQRTMIMLVMLPMWMNFLLRTYAWMTLLENTGLINRVLGWFGLGPYQMINTQGAVVLGMVYNYIPYMILPLYSIMVKIDEKVIEAAQDLGANPFMVITKVILPLSKPGIISGVTMVFVPAVSTFIISKMLGGGSNLMIGDLIDLQFLGNAYNPNLGSAISLLLMVLILICMGAMNSMDEEQMEEGLLL